MLDSVSMTQVERVTVLKATQRAEIPHQSLKPDLHEEYNIDLTAVVGIFRFIDVRSFLRRLCRSVLSGFTQSKNFANAEQAISEGPISISSLLSSGIPSLPKRENVTDAHVARFCATTISLLLWNYTAGRSLIKIIGFL